MSEAAAPEAQATEESVRSATRPPDWLEIATINASRGAIALPTQLTIAVWNPAIKARTRATPINI
jgi:hypothetical protein